MNESTLALVGVVISEPTLNRTRSDKTVTNFRLACTSRRYNRVQARWQEDSTLYLRVVCWQRLAENVVASVRRGDPVLVSGHLRARSYRAEDGERRTSFELSAASVGPDLNKGTAVFARGQRAPSAPRVAVDEEYAASPPTHLGAAALAAAGEAIALADPERRAADETSTDTALDAA